MIERARAVVLCSFSKKTHAPKKSVTVLQSVFTSSLTSCAASAKRGVMQPRRPEKKFSPSFWRAA